MNNEFINYLDVMEAIEEKQKTGDVNCIITNNFKTKVNNNFVILFYQSFYQIITEHNLSGLDIRVLLKLLEKMQFGNLIKYSQSSIAKEINSYQSNVSKVFKKLKESKIIIETDEGEEYVNPHILSKGNLRKQKKSEIYKQTKNDEINNY